MNEYLAFRKMITPILIQILFWVGVVAVVIGAFVMMANDAVLPGIAALLLGPLAVRIYCELLIVVFMINDGVQELRRQKLADKGATPPQL